MPVSIKIPVAQTINLNLPSDEDPDGEAEVKVRPATQREVEMRAASSKAKHILRDNGDQEIVNELNYQAQKALEVYLTLTDCNIVVPKIANPEKADDYKPAFRFATEANGRSRVSMTKDEFLEVWGMLPQNWADAIHKAVLEVNPQWNPNFQS